VILIPSLSFPSLLLSLFFFLFGHSRGPSFFFYDPELFFFFFRPPVALENPLPPIPFPLTKIFYCSKSSSALYALPFFFFLSLAPAPPFLPPGCSQQQPPFLRFLLEVSEPLLRFLQCSMSQRPPHPSVPKPVSISIPPTPLLGLLPVELSSLPLGFPDNLYTKPHFLSPHSLVSLP